MKCEFCAGDLSINDERCPHCDALNPFYEAHRKDMKRFEAELKSTEKEVKETTNKIKRSTLHIAIIAVLVVLNLIGGIFSVNSRDISYELNERKLQKRAPLSAKEAKALVEEQDYLSLNALLVHRSVYIRGNNPLTEYMAVSTVLNSYRSIFSQISNLINGTSYSNAEEIANTISTSLDRIYNERFEEPKKRDGIYYAKEHLDTIDDIITEINVLLTAYLGIDSETLADFPNTSSASRQLVLEEAIKEVMADE